MSKSNPPSRPSITSSLSRQLLQHDPNASRSDPDAESPSSPPSTSQQSTTSQCWPASTDSPHAKGDHRPSLPRTKPELAGKTPRHGDRASSDENSPVAALSRDNPSSPQMQSEDEATLRRLREEMHTKLLHNQMETKTRQGALRSSSGRGVAPRAVSPIREELSMAAAMSPSLEAAFGSPAVSGPQTASTDSTESVNTIRGGVPATPDQHAVRTPSYPFPSIPLVQRSWSSSFRPFTTLSPTTSFEVRAGQRQTHRDTARFDVSSPAPSVGTFVPADTSSGENSDPNHPSPNLYDLVLAINSEPGLDAWWSALSQIMVENYGADRLSLAIPADAGEPENVPWGQRATFSVFGRPEVTTPVKRAERNQQKPTVVPLRDVRNESTTPSRPGLQTRHSYAGFERTKSDVTATQAAPGRSNVRPRGPLRATSYAPLMEEREEDENTTFSPLRQPGRLYSQSKAFSDLNFSATGGSEQPQGPFEEVLPVLRALSHESHALLDSAGVNKILDRGSTVTLTRDYSQDLALRRDSATPRQATAVAAVQSSATQPAQAGGPETPILAPTASVSHKPTGDYFSRPKAESVYEEYEQLPASPWAQSPAPSPAIHVDPNENPFFATGAVDEASFEPNGTSHDYSELGQVETIGVDQASSIMHIPLIHPSLSAKLFGASGPSRSPSPPSDEVGQQGAPQSPAVDLGPRKAPLAILSILSPIVPYPPNLIRSLKLFAPHLASTYSNAQQYSSMCRQASLLTDRHFSGQSSSLGGAGAEAFRDLMDADIDFNNGSATGSITSSSDYSGLSRPSPGGSLVGTPAWDPTSIGFSSRHSVGSTPGHFSGSEMLDSYFDMKKQTLSNQSGRATHETQQEAISPGGRESLKTAVQPTEAKDGAKSDSKPAKRAARDDKPRQSDRSQGRSRSSSSKWKGTSTRVPERIKHTLLHSYGADFSSSFQSLPITALPHAKTPAAAGPTMSSANDEPQDMPPPSERLLRTIIDALPVQIFTAAPGTGIFTWVNSKFLVYRGQDSQQILQDPWEALHPDDRSHYMEEWAKCLSTGQQFSHKVRLRRFDDAFRWFYVRTTPLMDKKLKIVHWIGTNMDIHEQQVAETNAARQQETAASEAKYRALANSSPQIVFTVTRTRGLTFCNSQWPTYSGQTEPQAKGLGFTDCVHSEDLAKCRLPSFNEDGSLAVDMPTSPVPDIQRLDSSRTSSDGSSDTSKTVTSPGATSPAAFAMPQTKLSKLASEGILKVSRDPDGRPFYSTEIRLRSKEGDYRWHLVRVLLSDPIRSGDVEEEETWYGTCTDINDHKVLEKTLKDTMDAKSRFLSNMSHEIRTPLNGITGMVNFLIDSSLTSEQMEHVNIIRNSTEGLRDLINDILDLSKVEAGMITLQFEWMHVRSLIEEVNDLTSAMAMDKGLELNYIVEDDVPSMVMADKFRIRQVLLNVIGNAIKFTQQGEVFVRCSMDANTADDDDVPIPLKGEEALLKFEVIDTGSGFTEAEAHFLFKRFSQIDSADAKQQSGTGLGLAISMQLVELHGGSMKASSKPGKGSTFTFSAKVTLPEDQLKVAGDISAAVSNTGTPTLPPSDTVAGTTANDDVVPAELSPALTRRTTDSPAISISSASEQYHLSETSSASSDPSIQTSQTSIRSALSSVSSARSMESLLAKAPPMHLELPSEPRGRQKTDDGGTPGSQASVETERPMSPSSGPSTQAYSPFRPQLFSILVVCPMPYAREATVKHVEMTIPKFSPHHITARAGLEECSHMFEGEDAVVFTHIILVLRHVEEIIAFVDKVFSSPAHSGTSIVILTDLSQKRNILANSKQRYDYDQLRVEGRVRFVFKPLKTSKLAVVFDPQKEREHSTDVSQNNVQALAISQKQVFQALKQRLGGTDIRILLVEDNKTNQMVFLDAQMLSIFTLTKLFRFSRNSLKRLTLPAKCA